MECDPMQDWARIGLTGFVWATVGATLIVALNMAGDVTAGVVVMTLIGFAFATHTSRVIWGLTEQQTANKAEPIAKRKRTAPNSTELLLDLMDDDEREAFKHALAERVLARADRLRDADDGELPVGLDDLLDTPHDTHHRIE